MLWCSDGRVHYICEGVLHQKEEAMKITTKQITTTAVLLAICIVSQFFKNTSVYITGPVINACLILAVLSVGIPCGIILSVITPVTPRTRRALPAMIHGMIAGMAPMIGLPVIKNDVTGVITERSIMLALVQ